MPMSKRPWPVLMGRYFPSSTRVEKRKSSPETSVLTYVAGDKNDLKPGTKIIAAAKKQPDGTLETPRVTYGKDGLTPPIKGRLRSFRACRAASLRRYLCCCRWLQFNPEQV